MAIERKLQAKRKVSIQPSPEHQIVLMRKTIEKSPGRLLNKLDCDFIIRHIQPSNVQLTTVHLMCAYCITQAGPTEAAEHQVILFRLLQTTGAELFKDLNCVACT